MNTIVVVPAYRPDERLLTLLDALAAAGAPPVVLVDDGSGPGCAALFDRARSRGVCVLRHEVNRGKGAALRTAFAYVDRHHPGVGVVTADADGQHGADDVVAVVHALATGSDDLVLGVRDLTGTDVPARSRLGNTIAARAFRAVTGIEVADTQTGLRGFRPELLPVLGQVRGDRFDYEFRVLLQAAARGVRIGQVPISTVYLDHNASSHFRPGRDSLSVIGPLLAFSLSGLIAFGIDTLALLALSGLTGSLLPAVVGARLLSGAVNFLLNRRAVFRTTRHEAARTSAVRYAALAALLLAAGYGLLTVLHTDLGLPLLAAKVATDARLFLVAYLLQRDVVFAARPEPHGSDAADRPAPGRAAPGRAAPGRGVPVPQATHSNATGSTRMRGTPWGP